jgi:hypothetical protein
VSNVEQLISLLEKQIIVLKERAAEHGSFDVFVRAAYHADLPPLGMIKAMMGMKTARLENNPDNQDSLIDLLNYQAIYTFYWLKSLKGKQ